VPERPPAVRDALTYLRSLVAIRARCQQQVKLACADRLHHFAYHPEQIPAGAAYIVAVTRIVLLESEA